MIRKCSKCGIDKEGRYSYCAKCTKERNANYYRTNRERELKRSKEYQKLHSAEIKERNNNKLEEIRKYRAEYQKNRRKHDPFYRFMGNMRRNTSKAFRYKNKDKKTTKMIGCSQKELIEYIESLFRDGMSWENYGKWHIDHIIPLASAVSKESLENLCHYTNLQPLWATENLKKGCKLTILNSN